MRPMKALLRSRPEDCEIALRDTVLPIVIVRHPTARRLTLRLAADAASVRVTMPRWGRRAEAVAFVHDRREWLSAQLARRPDRTPPVAGGTIHFRGNPYRIAWSDDAPRRIELTGDTIRLGGPQDRIPARLKQWLRAQAQDLFAQDAAHYAAAAGLAPAPVALSNARRRWGSCSSNGTMRLNWRLVQAPDEVRRSVVAHETAHRVHFDHSPAFHALLGDLYGPGLAQADRWLRERGPHLFASFD